MRKFIYITSLLLATLAMPVKAEKSFNSLDLSVRSYHFNDRCYDECSKRFKEDNYGLGLTVEVADSREISVGFLQNSFDQTSYYAVVNFSRLRHLSSHVSIKPGIALGVANGYRDTVSAIAQKTNGYVPILSPNVSLYTGPLHWNLGILPSANTVVAIFRAGVRF